MASNEIVVGLDIGTTKIACIVGRRTEHGKVEIIGTGKAESAGVSRGIVANIVNTVESIKLAVEEAKKNVLETSGASLEVRVVNVGIAGQHIKSLQHRGMITRDDLDTEIDQGDIDELIDSMYKLVMMPGEEIIDVLPQEYIVDNEQGIKDPKGMSGIRLEANCHIITGQVAAIRNIQKCVEKAGLQIDNLILEPIASSDAVLSDEEKEAGVALVDIGGGTTDIAIFHDGLIRHTAVIPFGGNVVTEDIKNGLAVMKKQAEKLKVKFGSALANENQNNEIVCIPGLKGREPKEIRVTNLSGIIQARMEEIIENVYFEIKNSGYEKKLIGGVVVTGGGSQLRHIKQLFEYKTGLDAKIGYPTEHLAQSPAVHNVTSPMYATGIGLVLMGFNKALTQGARSSITGHSNDKRIGFLDKLFSKGRKFFEEDVE